MRGIVLAGGRASRLYPVTKGVTKHLLAVYDKPLIYYSLSALFLAGIKEILVISRSEDLSAFKALLGDGSDFGVKFSYAIQNWPKGIAESFLIGKDFIGDDSVCLVLGDNIFYGHGLTKTLEKASGLEEGAKIFGYLVKNPSRYGVIKFDKNKRPVSIIEKPKNPPSDCAVSGIYFYDNQVTEIAKEIKPSGRGELEITDINNIYLKQKKLEVKILGRGYAWLDTGTPDSLIDASIFVKTIEERQGYKIGCLEEIAYRKGYIGKKKLLKLADNLNDSYKIYLKDIAESE
ncbi:MAG: glucose-1-phosphate thymidylyltransferase RfbA [Candidatus Omnitrophota bacterium]